NPDSGRAGPGALIWRGSAATRHAQPTPAPLLCARLRNCAILEQRYRMNTPTADSGTLPSAAPDLLLPEALAVELAELFRALADPTRTRMVYALAQQEMTTTGLAGLLGVNAPAVSQHLRLLRTLRLVKPRRADQLVY